MSTLQTIQSNIPLPSPLEQLVGMVNSEAIEYAGRDDDTRQLQKWLDAGDFRMVEHSARSIIERQRQFRQAQQHGLPPALQQLVDLVNSEAIEYAGRDDDTRQLQKWLGAGDFRMVEHSAKSIIERQRQFRQAQQHGLPPALQQLVDLVNSEAIEYAGRDDDTRQLQKWLDAGDFRMVEHSARSIIERQRQFRQAQQHGLPPALQQLVDLVNSETIEYAGRDDDTRQLQKWLDAGDFRMVEHSARSIIERQSNIRGLSRNKV